MKKSEKKEKKDHDEVEAGVTNLTVGNWGDDYEGFLFHTKAIVSSDVNELGAGQSHMMNQSGGKVE